MKDKISLFSRDSDLRFNVPEAGGCTCSFDGSGLEKVQLSISLKGGQVWLGERFSKPVPQGPPAAPGKHL